MEVMSRAQDPLEAQISSAYMPKLHKSPYPVVDAIKRESKDIGIATIDRIYVACNVQGCLQIQIQNDL